MKGPAALAGALVVAAAALAALPEAKGLEQPLAFPGLQPQLAKLGDRVFLASAQGNVLSIRTSEDFGRTFSNPATVTVPGRMSLGMHRGPRIASTASTMLASVIAGTRGGGADGDVLIYRSADSGSTWSQPIMVNDVPGSAREGLHGMAATPGGVVVVAWLDLRQKGTRIYAAVSRDHGATWSHDALVYASPSGSVCECCHPSVAINNDGQIAVMFRNSLDGNRDLFIARSKDGVSFAAAEKSGDGSWTLDACPMDGGALVFDRGALFSVWRRENDIYLVTPGRSEVRLGPGRDPVVDRFGNELEIAWSAAAGVVLKRQGPTSITLGEGRFPSLVSLSQRTVVAWEHQGSVKVQSLHR